MGNERSTRFRLVLAGVLPEGKAGNAVSTEVMLAALAPLGDVTVLTHRMSPWPSMSSNGGSVRVSLGTQPFAVHGEALLAGRMHRDRFRRFHGAWVVNSRYASSLFAAGVPYAIWEATTIEDELRASSFRAIRSSGRGTGLGRVLHQALMPIGSRLEGMLYRRARAVLTMSPYTRDRILQQHQLAPEHVQVLAHPPAPTFTQTLAARSRAVLPRARAKEDPWKLLFVGRADDPRKNFPLLLAAVRQVRAGGRAVTLTVVGPHNARWRTRLDLGGIRDFVHFADAVPTEQLADAYLTHDVLVLPSRQEGFGIVVAEALSAGLPVVATRCGGPEQMIRESGAGILVDHNQLALAKGIEALLGRSGHHGMRERALGYARSALSFERFTSSVATITEALLRHPRAPV